MNNDIDKIRGYNPPSDGSGGAFLKLADGEEAKVRITSLPVIFQNEFKMGEETNISTRFAFVVWNHDINKAQIWVTNSATYGQGISPLLEDDEYGDWREYDIKIKRTGEKAQTRYHIRPGVKRYDLEASQLEVCNNLDIISLISKGQGASQVMWLSEWRELEEQGKAKKSVKSSEPLPDDDEQHEEEIDISEVPF